MNSNMYTGKKNRSNNKSTSSKAKQYAHCTFSQSAAMENIQREKRTESILTTGYTGTSHLFLL